MLSHAMAGRRRCASPEYFDAVGGGLKKKTDLRE